MRKIKQLLVFTMITACTLFGFSIMATAAVVSSGESEANIEFIAPTDIPDVVDPTDPSVPFQRDPADRDPSDPQDLPTGETGPLTLDFVSSILFGEHDIESHTQVYESTTLRPFIQVSDRRGTGEGWHVTASASSFKTTVDEVTSDSLAGSIIQFSGGEVVSVSTSTAPTPNAEITLSTDDSAAQIVTAPVDTGLGTWINRWFPSEATTEGLNDNVTLEVPAGSATIGTHTATITWTLVDAPGQ